LCMNISQEVHSFLLTSAWVQHSSQTKSIEKTPAQHKLNEKYQSHENQDV